MEKGERVANDSEQKTPYTLFFKLKQRIVSAMFDTSTRIADQSEKKNDSKRKRRQRSWKLTTFIRMKGNKEEEKQETRSHFFLSLYRQQRRNLMIR